MALTEKEIFDQMKSQLRSAIADCELIAKYPRSGAPFISLRKSLKLVEGCCRQAAHWREDARWLGVGLQFEKAHQIARSWLHCPSIKTKKMFTLLAAALRSNLVQLQRLETAATGHVGAILTPWTPSKTLDLGNTHRLPSGLIMPPAFG